MIADHVLAWARLPGPARLLSEIRQRLEAGRCGPRATIVLDISPEQRHQIGQLLGVRWQVGDAVVLRVEGPRIPCGTFRMHMGEAGWLMEPR